jgi:hypothetical protein
MATEQQLREALLKAHRAGDFQAAQLFADKIKANEFEQEKQGFYQPEPQGLDALSEEQVEDLPSLGGTVNQVAQGASLGFADEAQAGLLATIGVNLPESMGGLPDSVTLGEAYRGIRDEIRSQNDQFAADHPKTAFTAQLAGGALTGGAGLQKSLAQATGNTIKGKIAAGAIGGGTIGAAGGAGYSDAELTGDEKELQEFGQDVTIGTLSGIGIGAGAGGIQGVISKKVQKNQALKELLESNPDGEVASKQIVNNKVVNHPEAKKAIAQGLDEGDVFVMRSASPASKKGMLKMVEDYKAIKNNPRIGQRKQVSDIVGRSAKARYDALKTVNQKAGQQVDKAAQSLKQHSVNMDDEVSSFIQSLEQKGVTVEITKNRPKLNFDGSDFEGLSEAQAPIENIVKRMFYTRKPNAYDVHRLKKYIDNNVTYGGGKTGAQGDAERLIKGLRTNLDNYLDNLSPAYDKANTKYARTIGILKEVESLSGKNGVNARTLGLLANRNDSRAVSSARVAEAFDQLDEVSGEMGVRFKDSVSDLHIFANTLDKALPNQRTNSFKGQQLINDLAQPTEAAKRKVTDKVAERVLGVTLESRLEAIERLLLSDGSFQKITAQQF